MRVLVTGGSGFIGSHVVEALVARGHAVRSLDLVAPARQGPTSVEHVVGDIRDRETVAACLNRVDAVLHHAAKVGMGRDVGDLPDYVSVNDYGTAVLLDAATRRGIGRVVLASSMVVYSEGAYWCGEHGAVRPAARAIADLAGGQFDPRCPACGESLQSETVAEGAPFEPRSSCAATKLAQEHLCGVWARETGGTVVALRYLNVYGPRMPRDTPYAGVASIVRSALARGVAPTVYEDGRQRRDFVHVRDVAQANVAALEHTAAMQAGGLRPYNIASGEPRTVLDMASALAAVMKGPQPLVTGHFRAGDVRHVVASPDRARRELGFIARVTFEDGMRELAHDGAAQPPATPPEDGRLRPRPGAAR